MAAELMEGTGLAREIVARSAARAAELTAATGTAPCLATVLVGDDPASVTYVRMKENRSRKAGIASRHVELPGDTTTQALVGVLTELSADPAVHGILLQHPVPGQIDERAAFEAIAPAKDVDGVTMHSFAAMAFGYQGFGAGPGAGTGIGQGSQNDLASQASYRGFASATPGAIMRLLAAYDVEIDGQHAVVIGRSPILGKPVGMLLLAANATVTYCHSRTRDLPAIVATADIVVAAVGRPEFVRGAWIKPGAVVVDAGYNPGNVGDVAQSEAVDRASLLTPVPGGVGPMTIAVLLEQTVDAATAQLASAPA
jgi:methylenetetrahydrofolate dehydrogenase (NADP+)/methenyltetrahydrofolate cyclohydrolase